MANSSRDSTETTPSAADGDCIYYSAPQTPIRGLARNRAVFDSGYGSQNQPDGSRNSPFVVDDDDPPSPPSPTPAARRHPTERRAGRAAGSPRHGHDGATGLRNPTLSPSTQTRFANIDLRSPANSAANQVPRMAMPSEKTFVNISNPFGGQQPGEASSSYPTLPSSTIPPASLPIRTKDPPQPSATNEQSTSRTTLGLPTYPLATAPLCRYCDLPTIRFAVKSRSSASPEGRPYYACTGADCGDGIAFACWDDGVGVEPSHHHCNCGFPSRLNIKSQRVSRPGEGFYSCATARCGYYSEDQEGLTRKELRLLNMVARRFEAPPLRF